MDSFVKKDAHFQDKWSSHSNCSLENVSFSSFFASIRKKVVHLQLMPSSDQQFSPFSQVNVCYGLF